VHPHIYQELIRQHHADLDREAARASLAASVPRERRLDNDQSASRPSAVALLIRLRLGLLAGMYRGLLAAKGRVAPALADEGAPTDEGALDALVLADGGVPDII
jgi:hypothetical protein